MYYWHWLRNVVRLPHTTGYPTEPDSATEALAHPADVRDVLPRRGPFFGRSVAIRHVDGGSSNGCESELSLLSSPDYDFSRYGFTFSPSPKHADVLVVTGVITQELVPVIQSVFAQMTEPKRVVALGWCAINGWMFREAPNVVGSLDGIVPVTVSVAGCPPSPADMLNGLLQAVASDSQAGTEEVIL